MLVSFIFSYHTFCGRGLGFQEMIFRRTPVQNASPQTPQLCRARAPPLQQPTRMMQNHLRTNLQTPLRVRTPQVKTPPQPPPLQPQPRHHQQQRPRRQHQLWTAPACCSQTPSTWTRCRRLGWARMPCRPLAQGRALTLTWLLTWQRGSCWREGREGVGKTSRSKIEGRGVGKTCVKKQDWREGGRKDVKKQDWREGIGKTSRLKGGGLSDVKTEGRGSEWRQDWREGVGVTSRLKGGGRSDVKTEGRASEWRQDLREGVGVTSRLKGRGRSDVKTEGKGRG